MPQNQDLTGARNPAHTHTHTHTCARKPMLRCMHLGLQAEFQSTWPGPAHLAWPLEDPLGVRRLRVGGHTLAAHITHGLHHARLHLQRCAVGMAAQHAPSACGGGALRIGKQFLCNRKSCPTKATECALMRTHAHTRTRTYTHTHTCACVHTCTSHFSTEPLASAGLMWRFMGTSSDSTLTMPAHRRSNMGQSISHPWPPITLRMHTHHIISYHVISTMTTSISPVSMLTMAAQHHVNPSAVTHRTLSAVTYTLSHDNTSIHPTLSVVTEGTRVDWRLA